jgi:hypothetical protein
MSKHYSFDPFYTPTICKKFIIWFYVVLLVLVFLMMDPCGPKHNECSMLYNTYILGKSLCIFWFIVMNYLHIMHGMEKKRFLLLKKRHLKFQHTLLLLYTSLLANNERVNPYTLMLVSRIRKIA